MSFDPREIQSTYVRNRMSAALWLEHKAHLLLIETDQFGIYFADTDQFGIYLADVVFDAYCVEICLLTSKKFANPMPLFLRVMRHDQ